MLTKDQLNQIKYTNLIAHSHYSIPFGLGNVKLHLNEALKKGHYGFSLVDDFAMNGILEAYYLGKDKDLAKKYGRDKIPVLLGTKFNLTDSLENKESSGFNISAIATSQEGYKNLCYLTSLSSHPSNAYHDGEGKLIKRISFENLAERSSDLIIGSGNIDGILSQSIIKGTGQEEDLCEIFKDIFGDKFFIEIHIHPKTKYWSHALKDYQSLEEDIQKNVNEQLFKLAEKFGIKCCIVQDSYMIKKELHYLQNILINNHAEYKANKFYTDQPQPVMSVEEMYSYVKEKSSYITDEKFIELCENTNYFVDLTKKLNLTFDPLLPEVKYEEHPVNSTEKEIYDKKFNEVHSLIKPISPQFAELFKVSKARNDIALETSLKAMIRLGKIDWTNKEELDRLAIEIKVLARNGVINLLDYFLLLEDVTNYVRSIGKYRGFGRGSGGGSLLTYAMDISDVQPLKYKLLFERFFTQDRIGSQFHERAELKLQDWSSEFSNDIDIIVKRLNNLKLKFNKNKVKEVNQSFLNKELYYIECNESLIKYYEELLKLGKLPNVNSSTLAYVLDITDELPSKFIDHSEPAMPDFDYDTDGRDEIKAYLMSKNGPEHTTLIGTLGSLKTKGAIKDVIKQLRPDMDFTNEVNPITKMFDVVKRTDEDKIKEILGQFGEKYDFARPYSSELAYFFACLEAEPKLKAWFEKNADVQEAVTLLLNNAKSLGIHAGGIVVSRGKVMETVPLTWDYEENIWVTQYEMAYVEKAGLIKYDFLGLKTLGDFNRCLKLINTRYNKNYTLSNIPMDDQEVFKLFTDGKTESVFQFNTPLPVSLLTKLKNVNSIRDLAIITAILRPGPMKMGMHHEFVKRKNGEAEILYLHPSLEEIWSDTYGLCVFQETVSLTAKKLGKFSSDVSVAVMKALSKKQKEKVAKFGDKFIENAIKSYNMDQKKAQEIWDFLYAFSEYGFNASHSFAYCCVSYLCMWFKHYYPAEWISAVLSGSNKDDFKLLYPKWKDYIIKPTINGSKDSFAITDDNKVAMPFSAVNGVGDKAVEELVKHQPYSNFQDFLNKVDKSKVNKKAVFSLIFAGIFDEFRPEVDDEKMTEQKWRKTLVGEYYKHKFKITKPSAKDRAEAEAHFKKVVAMNRGEILMEEISILNFTAFDYFDYYHDKMTDGSRKIMGREALRPELVSKYPTDSVVVVGGSVEEVTFSRTKKGEEMARIKISNSGQSVEVVVFPSKLSDDDMSEQKMIRNLKEYMPIIIKGKVNRWNDRVSVIYEKAHILL